MPSDYVADAETAQEMVRLLEQDMLLTQAVSGLLPPDIDPAAVHDVLDIGCGPGGWVLDVGKAFPHIHVTGIDSSELMIDYAANRAIVERKANAHFQVMNFRQLDFPDASFDLVNARFIQWFIPADQHQRIASEWFRVVRPGGTIRFIENELPVFTNCPSLELSTTKFLTALNRLGKTISPGGRQSGNTLMLRPLLHSLGCQDIQETAQMVNFSFGTPYYEAFTQDILHSMATMIPIILATKTMSKRALSMLQEQTREDIRRADFLGLTFFVSACGRKPSERDPRVHESSG
jgi:ubiquinone/menaquinone biosynthesis C-methylase UbiE